MGKHGQDPRPSKAAIKGHPIHPMLIPFPIAFLALVPVSDIAFAATGDLFWARASYYLLWAGLGAGLLAGLAGLVDFIGISRARSHRHGWIHLGTTLGVLALAAVNVLLRIETVAAAIVPSGLLLSLVGLGLLAVAGWVGGELAYRHKIGVVGQGEDEGEVEGEEDEAHPPERGAASPGRAALGKRPG